MSIHLLALVKGAEANGVGENGVYDFGHSKTHASGFITFALS